MNTEENFDRLSYDCLMIVLTSGAQYAPITADGGALPGLMYNQPALSPDEQ